MATGGKAKHRIIWGTMAMLWVLLLVRLLMLTVPQEEKWSAYAEDMSRRVVYETAPRGDILDRNGQVLATSRPVYSVTISRVDLHKEKALKSASQVLEHLKSAGEDSAVTSDEVARSLDDTGYNGYMPITLAEDIKASTAYAIEQAGYDGVEISKSYVREYPSGALAAHIIGYMGRISDEEKESYTAKKGYRADSRVGKSGVERLYEDSLRGVDAAGTLQVDSLGRVTGLLSQSSTKKGKDVRLTLDLDLQKTTEEALEQAVTQASLGGTFHSEYGDYKMVYAKNAAVGAAVAIDVKSGQVLAMASYPDFDPNDFAVSISQVKWKNLQQENKNDPLSPSPLYNVATMTAVQPGSTFKPVTALTALSCGLDEKQSLYDGGVVSMGDRTFGCSLWNDKKTSHGYVDLAQAIKVSCNYYFYDIATGMDLASGQSLGYDKDISNEAIVSFARNLGLGEKTGIEIEEAAGTLPSRQVKLQSAKTALRNYLLAERETYFDEKILHNDTLLEKNIKKIINWADKDLTLEEIIGKLKQQDYIRKDKIQQLAETCKYSYFNQAKWTKGDTFNVSIGQGNNAYTPLQMASYMAALGNGGVGNQVSVVLNNEDRQSWETGINQDHIQSVLKAMEGVAREPEGSLYRAFGGFPYSVAAKTGTAQRAGKINTSEEKDYLRRHLHLIAPDISFRQVEEEAVRLMEAYPDLYDTEVAALRRAVMDLSKKDLTSEDIDRYKENYDNFAWTVALAPAENPQIAVAVLLVQGKSSSNAAPVVREIIGRYGEISEWEKSF